MSLTLNTTSISNPTNIQFQGYGSSEGICLPCLGVSVRASVSQCPPLSECKTLEAKISSSKCSSRTMSLVCSGSPIGPRRNSDFSRQNENGFSQNRNRHINGRESFDKLDGLKFLSTNYGSLLSFSNNAKSKPTGSPGPKERELVELFRKVQVKLRERAATEVEKKRVSSKVPTKESKAVDSLLELLRKHAVEQGKRKVNEDYKTTKKDPEEKLNPSLSRPPSVFQRRSPVSNLDMENMDMYDEKEETKSEPQNDVVETHAAGELSESESSSEIEENDFGEDDTKKQQMEAKDLTCMKLPELRALAKARGMKGFTKLKKSELVGLLSEDPI